MSPGSVLNDARAQVETCPPDRRLFSRYPIILDLQYKLPNQDSAKPTGSGRTLSISSGGIFFRTKNRLPVGCEIDLDIDWPCLLDGVSLLKLVVHGYVVRHDAKGTAVEVSRYEFRTRRAQPSR
jgi:c-di-GMP-binding flagellar brake protein YcgR